MTSSPRYAQSNGKVEKAVSIMKSLLRKCEADGTDIYIALLDQRNTPTTGLKIPLTPVGTSGWRVELYLKYVQDMVRMANLS